MKPIAPPRVAVALLRWALTDQGTFEGILGDLTEALQARCTSSGRRRAIAWFWVQSLWIAVLFRVTPGRGKRRLNDRRPGLDWPSELLQAGRSLRRAPGFSAVAVSILALGIGAATTMVSAVDAVLLRDLPVTQQDRIVTLTLQDASSGALPLTPDEVEALNRESRMLTDVAGVSSFGVASVPLTEGDRGLALDMAMVTPGFFELLGARSARGRLIRAQDGDDGAAPVAVISYRTWQTEFAGDPGVVGRRLTTTQDQRSYEIVGVAPPGLDYPVGADYWTLYYPRPILNVIARLAPGATPEIARSEFLSIVRTFDRVGSEEGPIDASVGLLEDAVLGDARPVLVAVAAAVALLLVIACVNVGNLLLMRGTRRAREVVVRRALGASFGKVARLFLMESVILGATAGAVGLGIAAGLTRLLPSFAPRSFPRSEMIGLDGLPIVGAIGVTLVATALFGVLPALAAARGNLASTLRANARSGGGTRRQRRLQRTLVASQVALALMLLVGAGLLTRSLERLTRLDLGYQLDRLAIVELGVSYTDYQGRQLGAMYEEVFDRLRGVPGVTALTPVMSRPFLGSMGVMEAAPRPEGQPETGVGEAPSYPLEIGDHEYFRTLGIPILRGRGFEEGDREDAPRVAVVSEAVAARLWPGEDPVGQRVSGLVRDGWWTVVGLAADTRFRGFRQPTPTIYVPWRQLQVIPAVVTLAIRTDAELSPVLPGMRKAVRAFDSDFYVWKAETMADYLDQGPLAQPRASAVVLSGFGLAALLLVAMGLYGVVSLSVRERTHDLGVRQALGATAARLRHEVLRDALGMSVMGAAAGLVGALVGSRLLRSLLFDVSPTDPLTLAAACGVILTVAMLAAYVPARRATRIDSREALRVE